MGGTKKFKGLLISKYGVKIENYKKYLPPLVKPEPCPSLLEGLNWNLLNPAPFPLEHSVAGFAPGINSVVVSNGFSSYIGAILDMNTGSWRLGPSLDTVNHEGNAVTLPFEDTFIVVGGYKSDGTYDTQIRKFDYNSETFVKLADLVEGKSFTAAILIPDDYFQCQ